VDFYYFVPFLIYIIETNTYISTRIAPVYIIVFSGRYTAVHFNVLMRFVPETEPKNNNKKKTLLLQSRQGDLHHREPFLILIIIYLPSPFPGGDSNSHFNISIYYDFDNDTDLAFSPTKRVRDDKYRKSAEICFRLYGNMTIIIIFL